MPGPFAPPGGMYPALYLYPLNDSFVPKHICLAGGQRVKIGRQTNAKTVPAERNGFFDSKVLSRQHAEVWEEAAKIYIKDVKSSNGTFINGERLSPEGHESEPFELKTEDIVEFGIDIVGEDNKTVVHHKVAARVTCVFNDNDAASAQRSEASGSMGGPMNGFNFGGPNGSGGPRRPGLAQPAGLGGMGGMGSMRPPGKSGLTFDHIISRLQGELQKSRETGADLHSLTSVMGEVHDTLGGQMPNQLPPFPAQLGPVRPPAPEATGSSAGSDSGSASASIALGELQEQLRETQSSLAGHVDKVRALEGVLAEHDAIKREVANLRETLSVRPSQPKMALQRVFEHTEQEEGHSEFDAEDDDDIRSVGTAVPHELDRVEEEDEEALRSTSDDEEAHRAPRPRTPEPGSLGLDEDEHRSFKARGTSRPLSGGHFTDISLSDRPASPHTSIPDELSQRLTTLASQLETALELSRTLQQQQQQAQSTISALQEKVNMLEGRVQVTEDAVEHTTAVIEEIKSAPESTSTGAESLTDMMSEFKKHVEGKWSGVQEEWISERERLRRATEEWERRAGALELSVNGAVSRVDAGLERAEGLVRLNAATAQAINDVRNHGLATPPSPRSLSADSPRSTRMRRRRGSRSSSHSGSSASAGVDMHPALESSSSGSGSEGTSAPSSLAMSFIDSPRRMKMPWASRAGAADLDDDIHEAEDEDAKPVKPQVAPKSQTHLAPRKGDAAPGQVPLTPKASFEEPRSDSTIATKTPPDLHLAQYSSALGVVVLSVAAAAVMYRVRPDFAS